jgi:thioredoxin reductase (NADPH)
MNEPVILVVDDDAQVLAALRRDLRSRYREDYRILAAGSGESALDTIRDLKARGDALAMVITDQRMPSMLGVDVLAKTSEMYPIARKVLLTAYSDVRAAIRAINEARVDYYLEKPWDPPEERLFPAIDDLLGTWHAEYRPEVTGIRLIGYQWSPRSHDVKTFLAGNLVPYQWLDVERDPAARALLASTEIAAGELPALILEDGTTLRNPDIRRVAESLGLATSATHDLYDLIIVGAGPTGLAAAVYGASEGMKTLLLDGHAPGGQAAESARIENYLGFPSGISGTDLTRRAVAQAQRLGTEFIVPVEVSGLSAEGNTRRVTLADGRELLGRAVLVATGMTYRHHTAEGIAACTGAGVYYGATTIESHSCRDRRVFIIGGGNSAGQAAVHLSRYANEVHIVVRRDGLNGTMSQYLLDQIAAIPRIHVWCNTVLERVEGDGRLERLWLRSIADDSVIVEEADAVFVYIGTRPRSEWLPETVLKDSKGFVLTGNDMATHDVFPRLWKETRQPLPLETSIPGVFAAGDVRAGAMNRVASAVGEGAMAVRLVSEYLSRT